MFDIQNSYF